jgi:hypothetical protein
METAELRSAPAYDYGHFHWSERAAADEAAISTLEYSGSIDHVQFLGIDVERSG